jgi:nucleic acid/nucleotide deaminase of polymorphic system toxin
MRLTESSLTLNAALPSLTQFLQWLEQLFTAKHSVFSVDPKDVVFLARWSEQARQYSDFLKLAFPQQAQPESRWISSIWKLGRYSIASKSLVRLAREFPALFNPMRVERIPAPALTLYRVDNGHSPLKTVLRRTVGDGNADELTSRLGRIWNTQDPEAHFRKACSLNLTVHAEIQLLAFYDHNSEFKPVFRFMGVSKKSCYLCHKFLMTHPESFTVSSCHQRLYASWIPPPAAKSAVYKRYKTLIADLSKSMESTAKQDLVERLGGPRRPVPLESTGGVSLSGLATPSIARARTPVSISLSQHPSYRQNEKRVMEFGLDAEIAKRSMPHDLEAPDIGSSCEESGHVSSIGGVQESEVNSVSQVASMVFHITRADDPSKQDIVCMNTIISPVTNRPSWANLVGILEQDGDFEVGFKEGHEFIVFNGNIRVANERQFLAAVQYLHNLKIWSSEALVDSFDNRRRQIAFLRSCTLERSKKRKEPN